MSNHNLYVHGVNGTVQLATSEQILVAASGVLAHRVGRGALLQSPQKVGEYLTMRVGHLDYECFGLILVDGRHRVIDCVELFRGTIDGASVYPREVVKLVDGQAGRCRGRLPPSPLMFSLLCRSSSPAAPLPEDPAAPARRESDERAHPMLPAAGRGAPE